MQVHSTRFGDIDVDEDRLVRFDEGPLGFPLAVRFALVDVAENEDFYWLQSVDDPELAFLTTVPWPFFPDYAPELPDELRDRLEIIDPVDATVLCLLSVDRDAGEVRANLLGPVVINTRTRKAAQVVLYDQEWSLAAPLGGS